MSENNTIEPKTGIVEMTDEEIAKFLAEGQANTEEPDFDQGSAAGDVANSHEDDSQEEVDGEEEADVDDTDDSGDVHFTERSQAKMLKRINRLTAQLKTAREEIERMNATHAEEEAKAKAAEDARYASLAVLPEYLTKEDRELLDQYSAELDRYEYSIEFWQNGFNSGEGVTLSDKSYTAEECAKHVASLSRSAGIFQTKREAILNNARQKMRDDLREFRKTKEGNVGSTPKAPIVKPSAITGRVTTRVVQPGLAGSTSVRESNSGNTRPANVPKTQDEARAWFGNR